MTTPTGLELVWADAGGVTNPGQAKYEGGWVAEIPTYQHFNYVIQSLDRAKLSYAEADIYGWNAAINYGAGARVERAGKTFYCVTNHINQDPSLDTTGSYWVHGTVFSSDADAFTNLKYQEGVRISNLQVRTNPQNWDGNDITLWNKNNVIAFNISNSLYNNQLLANIRGEMVVVNTENTAEPSGVDLRPDVNDKSYRLYHEGNKPKQSDVSGTIPEAPTDGKSYARVGSTGNWVEVTSTTVQPSPPPPVLGAGQGWYNLDDGRFYIDINDGTSSQWVPASPPVVADLSPLEQKISDMSNAFVGMESFFPPRAGSGVHPAWIEKAGGTFSRTAYPSLWAWADAHGLVVSEAAWQAIKVASPNGSVSVFSSGDGSTTFRVPDVGEEGGFARALKGASVAPIGDIDGGFEDQIQNITSRIASNNNEAITLTAPSQVSQSGAMYLGDEFATNVGGSLNNSGAFSLNFDASRSARTGTETSPRGSYQRVYIYTGNIVENLPIPTPDWLTQQGVNTGDIAGVKSYQDAIRARTWQNLTGSRGVNVTYTNNSTSAIEISVSLSLYSGSGTMVIDGIDVATYNNNDGSFNTNTSAQATVNVGSTYMVRTAGANAFLSLWSELR